VGLLAPWFLLGLLGLGLPVWLHLLRRRHNPPRPFPSLMFFERRPQSSIRQRRLRYWGLLLLRCLLLAALVLAFARPYRRVLSAGAAERLMVLALDESFSMRQADRMARAGRAAMELLGKARPGERVEVIAFASRVRVLSQPSSDPAAARAAIGPASVLVNNAGLLRTGPLETVSLAAWNEALAVNLTGYLICARAFGRDMLAAGKGSLVHVASISAINPQTSSGAYSASKAGVLLLSRQFAAEWGPRGVRSNAILPGMIKTPLSAKFYEEPGFEAKRAAAVASRRVGLAEDLAGPALFLASDRAAYVNGAELLVDGGLDCMLMDMVPRPGFNATPISGD